MSHLRSTNTFLVFAALALAGLGAAWWIATRPGTPPSSAARHLTIGIGRDFFDGPDSRTYLHGSTNTWEALTYLDEHLEAAPWLAESWEALDGNRTWVFRLRAGVRFHDGSPLTAAKAAASIDRIRRHPKYDPSGVLRGVETIEAPDDRTVLFRLRAPSHAFANLIAYYQSPVLEPRTFDAAGHLTGLVGTGPYRLERIDRGQRVTVTASPDYWGAPPLYDTVTFRTIPDAHVRASALAAGEVDAIADVGAILPAQVETLRRTPHVVVVTRPVATTHYLVFNCARAPFDAPGARRSLAAAIDRPALVSALVGSGGVVARDPFTPLARRWAFGLLADPSTGPAAAEAAASAPPAPAQVSAPPPSSVGASPPPGALALPAPDAPVHMVLSSAFVQRWPYLAIAQHIQDRMRRAGWASTIAVLEPGAYQDVLRRRAFDLVVQPNTLMTGDPDFFYSYYVESAGPQSFGCGSAAIDALVGLARDEPDPTARRERYRELAAWVARELPFVPLYHDLTAYAYRDHLPGFTIDAWFRPMLTRAGEGRPP